MKNFIKSFIKKNFPYLFNLLKLVRFSLIKQNEKIEINKSKIDIWLPKLAAYTLYSKAYNPTPEKPIVILSSYNDNDIIESIISRILEDSELIVIDNWSTDGTWEIIQKFSSHPNLLHAEQFPLNGPTEHYEWKLILDRKAKLAKDYPNRWIMHQDSDEITLSPIENFSISQILSGARLLGYNVIPLRMIDFRPIDNKFVSGNPIEYFQYFLFSDIPSYQLQNKIWIQPIDECVDLSSTGGHNVNFLGKNVLPIRFPRLHYSIRSKLQIQKKHSNRLGRIEKEKNMYNWHVHIKESNQERVLFDKNELIRFKREDLYSLYKDKFSYDD